LYFLLLFLPMNTPSPSPADILASVMRDNQPFALMRKEGEKDLFLAQGPMVSYDRLSDIPRKSGTPEDGEVIDTISAIPFSQIRERGFAAIRGDARIQSMQVQQSTRISLDQVLALLPAERIELKDGLHFDKDDATYAAEQGKIITEEIGNGEGSSFVVPRRAEGLIVDFDRRKALSIFRALLESEFGSYMTFAFCDGERYLIGASPERHLSVRHGEVRMNPISGTFRKTRDALNMADLIKFLRDPKEMNELFMVLDEELKMMAQMCKHGGEVRGPFLREMSKLIHTEYELVGTSDQDVIDLFRRSMYAPTVTGSPVENACKVICKYDPKDRRFYSSALMLLGRDAAGRDLLDSCILIRMMEIHPNGTVQMTAGSTLVRDSDPMSEASESTAKLSALASSLGVSPANPRGRELPPMQEELSPILAERNAELSRFFFENQAGKDMTVEEIRGKRITIIMSDDDFAHTLGHMMGRMGADVSVRHYSGYDATKDSADLVVVGPGTGDPNNLNDPKMRSLAAILIDLEHSGRPFMAVCLGHQLLCKLKGMSVERKADPSQGVQRREKLFGEETEEPVGYYNAFAAKYRDIPGVEISYDPETGEVHALRGKNFASFQFHPESVLTKNGFEIVKKALVSLFHSPKQ